METSTPQAAVSSRRRGGQSLLNAQLELEAGKAVERGGWVSVRGFPCLQLAYPLSGRSH